MSYAADVETTRNYDSIGSFCACCHEPVHMFHSIEDCIRVLRGEIEQLRDRITKLETGIDRMDQKGLG